MYIAPKWGGGRGIAPAITGAKGHLRKGVTSVKPQRLPPRPKATQRGHRTRTRLSGKGRRQGGGEYTGHALRGVTKLKDSDGSTSKAEAECEGRPGQRQGATPDGRRGAQRQTITELKRTYSKGVIHSDLLVALADTLK